MPRKTKRDRSPHADRPEKKVRLLDNTDDEDSDSPSSAAAFTVNQDYARRFEHNKKRAEQHRLEEKYGNAFANDDEDEDSEEGVEEDDDAELLTEALDDDLMATLNALRSKDPRIYDKDAKFYKDPDNEDVNPAEQKEASMTLRQYHTKNLLDGTLPNDDDDDAPPTYAQEQESIRKSLVNAAADDDDDDFLVAKPKPVAPKNRKKLTHEDVIKADHDPELFLSNYMESRAWKPADKTHFTPLESDDDDEDAAIDEYEHAYNTYFEDTTGTNEKLTTYARDAVAATTVRRDDGNSRKKARDIARAKREAERKEREQDLARLRKLKVDEMEAKVKQIRKIGGLRGRDFHVDEWKDVLEADWSDDQWDAEMAKRFGDAYYDAADASGSDADGKAKKPKKPKFDDIDIKDLIPDFDEKPTLTDDDDDDDDDNDDDNTTTNNTDNTTNTNNPTTSSSKSHKQSKADQKAQSRRDRRLLESLAADSLTYEAHLAANPTRKASSKTSTFRYRATSPTTFGLTPLDILLATDQDLNDFAGLKKLATFRDPDKKKKDRKNLGKKARLRQWRVQTFGDPDGPSWDPLLATADDKPKERVVETEHGIVEKKKKRRSRKRKGGEDEV